MSKRDQASAMEHKSSEIPDQPGQPRGQRSTPGVELDVAEKLPQPAMSGVIIDTTAGGVTIIVREDRLRLVLTEHASRLRTLGWIAPLGIFLSLLATLVASDFKSDRFGLAADTWHIAFVAVTIVAAVWLAIAAILRLGWGGRGRAIDNCVRDIKRTTVSGTPRLG